MNKLCNMCLENLIPINDNTFPGDSLLGLERTII